MIFWKPCRDSRRIADYSLQSLVICSCKYCTQSINGRINSEYKFFRNNSEMPISGQKSVNVLLFQMLPIVVPVIQIQLIYLRACRWQTYCSNIINKMPKIACKSYELLYDLFLFLRRENLLLPRIYLVIF